MAIPKTEQEIFDTIQNMQPGDDFTLADAVLGMLANQRIIAKALLEITNLEVITLGTKWELERFLGKP